MSQKIKTFFTFQGNANEALNHYLSIFPQAKITNIQRYGPNDPGGTEGSIMLASFSLYDQTFMAIDSNIQHAWTFTPAISLYITCSTEAEINHLFEQLSQDGKVLMPLDTYPFSPKFAWLADKFGVTWQLNLEPN